MPGPRPSPLTLATALVAALALSGAGPFDPPDARNTPQPLDPGYGDMGPLSAQSRVVPMDLREPSGFERVYSLGRGPDGKTVYARVSGGLVATYTQSDYMATPYGAVSAVPPGTVFRIGKLSDFMNKPADSSAHSDKAVGGSPNRSAAQSAIQRATLTPNHLRSSAANAAATAADEIPIGELWNSEPFRQSRVCSLIDNAFKTPHETPR